MIEIKNKKECCGCTACYSICPTDAIMMKKDDEGFYYPEVIKNKCIGCERCIGVCPMDEKEAEKCEETYLTGHYAIQYRGNKERKISTAGGFYYLIAEYVLKQGGVVFAAGYNEKMELCHMKATTVEEAKKLCGSKYVQSNTKGVFTQVLDELKKEKIVLFVGTPCQVRGLNNYIPKRWAENLVLLDLLCLGCSSPGLFEKWKTYLEIKYHEKVINVEFRNKNFGYSTPNVCVYFKSGKIIEQSYDSKCLTNTFFKGYNVRPSCYRCDIRTYPRCSDFTVGDFNDISDFSPELDDDLGTSSVWCHTKKGNRILELIKEKYVIGKKIEVELSNVIGGKAVQMQEPEQRDAFFRDFKENEFKYTIKKWQRKTFKDSLLGNFRKVVNKTPFRRYVFKKMRKMQARRFEKNQRTLQ